MAVDQKLVQLRLATEDRMVVQQQAGPPAFLVERVGRHQPRESAPHHDQVERPRVDGPGRRPVPVAFPDGMGGVHHLVRVAVRPAVIADAARAGPVGAQEGEGGVPGGSSGGPQQPRCRHAQQCGAGAQERAAPEVTPGDRWVGQAQRVVIVADGWFSQNASPAAAQLVPGRLITPHRALRDGSWASLVRSTAVSVADFTNPSSVNSSRES